MRDGVIEYVLTPIKQSGCLMVYDANIRGEVKF